MTTAAAPADQPQPVHLDWSKKPYRYDREAAPCRICGTGAHMRDEHGTPCHKICAEQEATARSARTTDNYETRTV